MTVGHSGEVGHRQRATSAYEASQALDTFIIEQMEQGRDHEPIASQISIGTGCAAIERGPLVYCVEQTDMPAGTNLEEVEIDIDARPALTRAKDIPDEILAISVKARLRGEAAVGRQWPYTAMSDVHAMPGAATAVTAIPYFAWANREAGPMRVWLPVSQT